MPDPQTGQKAVFGAIVLPHFEQYMERLHCERTDDFRGRCYRKSGVERKGFGI
jgi:hypothetical protein